MTDNGNDNATEEPQRRGRSRSTAKAPAKRQYRAELVDLKMRVTTAVMLLRKMSDASPILATAIELLEGKAS